MEIDNYCYGCMYNKENIDICPRCGYINGNSQEEHYYLKEGYILNGKYLVGKVLGHGGFGITYLGLDIKLQIKVAIKEYLPSDISTRALGETTVTTFSGEKGEQFEYGLKKFLDEARTLARYNSHPCIVSITDFFEENNTAYLVMEYLDGVPLNDYLKEMGGKIDFNVALNIMMPVMDALREVHSSGMIHRDVSPDNIYITSNKQVKLIDFGAARYAIGEKNKSLSVVLKPGYAPEEQYRTRGKQGPWTDVYAVGATIYKMITGETPLESLERLSEDDLKPPSQLGINISKDEEEVLMKALEIRGVNRYQTMNEFQDTFINKPIKNKEKNQEIIEHNEKNNPVNVYQENKISKVKKNKVEVSKDNNKQYKPKDRLIAYAFAVPAILIVLYLKVIPFFKLIPYSLKNNNNFVGLDNFKEVLDVKFFISQLNRDMSFNVITYTIKHNILYISLFSISVLILSLLIYKIKSNKICNGVLTLLLIPYFIPPVIYAMIFKNHYGIYNYIFVEILRNIGIPTIITVVALRKDNILSSNKIKIAINIIMGVVIIQLSAILSSNIDSIYLVSEPYNRTIDAILYTYHGLQSTDRLLAAGWLIKFIIQLPLTIVAYLIIKSKFVKYIFTDKNNTESLEVKEEC